MAASGCAGTRAREPRRVGWSVSERRGRRAWSAGEAQDQECRGETGRQLLHDQRRHPRTWQEAYAQELDDVWVAKGAHQLTLSHELVRRFLDAFARHLPRVLEKVVDLLGGAHGSGNGHLLHAAVRARPDSPARGASGGEEERMEVGVVAEERLGQGLGSHCAAI